MKKAICFSLMVAMLFCSAAIMPSSASAVSAEENTFSLPAESDPAAALQNDNPYAVQSEITFSPVRNAPSSRELGIMKLREAGCSDFTIESFSDEELELLSTATKVITSTLYFAEIYDEESGETSMVGISCEDFQRLEEQDVVEEEEIPVLIPSDSGSEADIESLTITVPMNGGLLKVEPKLFRVVDSNNPGGYCVTSEFLWSRMPKFRGTDVFAITRDSGTVEVPNFRGRIQYSERRRVYNSFGSTVTVSPAQYYTHAKSLSNDAPSNTGYGIRFNEPTDVPAPSYMFPNQLYTSRQYYNLRGHVRYYGYLRYPNITPQYFNHWITYLHKKGNAVNLGFSFSVSYPIAAAISIAPKFRPKFDRMDATLIARWDKR